MSIHRFEGRLFAEGGTLFMVLKADDASGTARVGCRMDGERIVIDMPLTEVASRVAASSHLMLDNLNGPNAEKRLTESEDGWYFESREGRMGPFESKPEAAVALGRHVLSKQTSRSDARTRTADAGRRPSPRRRVNDHASELRAAS